MSLFGSPSPLFRPLPLGGLSLRNRIAMAPMLARLIAAREALRQGLPGEPLYGMTPEAGLPKGFAPSAH